MWAKVVWVMLGWRCLAGVDGRQTFDMRKDCDAECMVGKCKTEGLMKFSCPLVRWELILIIIFSIIAVALIILAIFLFIRARRRRNRRKREAHKTQEDDGKEHFEPVQPHTADPTASLTINVPIGSVTARQAGRRPKLRAASAQDATLSRGTFPSGTNSVLVFDDAPTPAVFKEWEEEDEVMPEPTPVSDFDICPTPLTEPLTCPTAVRPLPKRPARGGRRTKKRSKKRKRQSYPSSSTSPTASNTVPAFSDISDS